MECETVQPWSHSFKNSRQELCYNLFYLPLNQSKEEPEDEMLT